MCARLSTFAVFGILFFGFQSASAWTGPTLPPGCTSAGGSPPSCNTSAPLNVGTISQAKNGNLGVNGLSVFGNSLLDAQLNPSPSTITYLNFSNLASPVSGSAGYGVRDNNGIMEFKNSGGAWATFTSGASQWVTSGTSIYYNTGNVGIGIITPLEKLHVFGTGAQPSLTTSNGIVHIGNNRTQALDIGASDASPWAMWLQTKRSNNDGTSWPLALNPLGGNVGIGTVSPGQKLSVTGTIGISESGGSGGRLLISSSGTGAVINQNDNSAIIFQSQGSELMRAYTGRLDVAGNVNVATGFCFMVNGTCISTGGVTEAPINGTIYGRKDGTWVSVGAGGGIAGSGTTNYISRFTPNGTTLGNSTLTSDGASATANGNFFVTNAIYTNEWLRVNQRGVNGIDTGGIYWEGFGGGWHMTDSTWLRAYNGKSIFTSSVMRADGGFCIGASCITAWPGGGVGGSGTLNYVPKFTPNGTTLGNSQIFDNGTSVGIGNASPAGRLTVNSGASAVSIHNADVATGAWLRNNGVDTVLSTNVGSLYLGYSGNTAKTIHIGNTAPGAVQIPGSAPAGTLVMSAAGNVGIGNAAPDPLIKLNVSGLVRAQGGLYFGTGNQYLYDSGGNMATIRVGTGPDPDNYSYITFQPGGTITGISGGVGIGGVAAGWYSDGVNLAARFPGGAGNFIVQSNGAGATYLSAGATAIPGSLPGVWIPGNGYISGDLTVAGDVRGSKFLYNSDARLKKDIQALAGNLKKVLKIQPVTYLWKDPSMQPEGTQIGFIAQNVKSVVPEIVHTDASTTLLSIDYARLAPLLVGSVQELNAKIDAQQKEIDELRAAIREIANK